jgi:catechol 2,3-dioxygenase-like lactoylglutathione lyase family enzyme
MIADAELVAFVASADLDRSRVFYVETLGLRELEYSPFALVVDGGGTTVRITQVTEPARAAYTVLGWLVSDLDQSVEDLRSRGVEFTRYPGMEQDDHDAWRAPSGARIAWFSDPDGNTLSLTELD